MKLIAEQLSALIVTALIGATLSMAMACSTPQAAQSGGSEPSESSAGEEAPSDQRSTSQKPDTQLEDTLERYRQSEDDSAKFEILRRFKREPNSEMVPILVETLALDVDDHDIRLHAYSCELLGEIAQQTPDAASEKAIRALVRALFLGDTQGRQVATMCGVAIQQVGAKAVPVLLETFRGNNEEVNALLERYNKAPKFAFPANHAKAIAAVRLASLRSKDAVEPLLADLAATKKAPESLSRVHSVRWKVTEGEAISEIIYALGEIGDEKATEMMIGIVQSEKIDEEWDEVTDWYVELRLRQDAASALVQLGDRKAADVLLEMAEKGVVADQERLAKVLTQSNSGRAMPPLERYQLKWKMAEAYVFLAGADGLDGLNALIDKTKVPELKEKYQSFIPALREGGRCLDEDKSAAKAGCFAKLLGSDDEFVRKKAAYEIGRLPAHVAGPTIVRHLSHDDLETRVILTVAAYDAPEREMIAEIDQILEREAGRGGAFNRDHFRLELLRAWVVNHEAEAAQK